MKKALLLFLGALVMSACASLTPEQKAQLEY